MKKYTELVIRRDELISELKLILSSMHSRTERKATMLLRSVLDSNKLKSSDLREAIGVLKYNNCPDNILEMAEELCAQQLLLEDQYYIDLKSQSILNELEVLRKLPERNGRTIDFEIALATIAIAGSSPEEFVTNLRCDTSVSSEVKKLIDIVMSVRSTFDGVISCRQMSLDSLTA